MEWFLLAQYNYNEMTQRHTYMYVGTTLTQCHHSVQRAQAEGLAARPEPHS